VLEAPTPLREPACHMGSHRVTYHPTEAASPALTPAGTRFIQDERLTTPVGCAVYVQLPCFAFESGILILCQSLFCETYIETNTGGVNE